MYGGGVEEPEEILWGGRRSRDRGCLSVVFSFADIFLLSFRLSFNHLFLHLTSHFELLDTKKRPPKGAMKTETK